MHNQTHPPIPLDLLAVQRDKKNQRRSPEPWPRGALCSHTGDRSRAPPCWGSHDAPVLARRAPRPSLSPLPAFGCRSAPWLGPSLHGSGPAPPETPAPGVPSLARVSAHRRCFRCTPLHWCRCWYQDRRAALRARRAPVSPAACWGRPWCLARPERLLPRSPSCSSESILRTQPTPALGSGMFASRRCGVSPLLPAQPPTNPRLPLSPSLRQRRCEP